MSSSSADARKRAAEIEASRARKGGLSCAECRSVFPCQACIRRGCASICPDGAMAATKGNKVLAAHAQKLSEQVKSMSARIKELEKALSNAQSQGGRTAQPTLQHDMSRESSNSPTFSAPDDSKLEFVSDAIGSLSIGVEGQARYHGGTAGSEVDDALSPQSRDPKYLGLPFELLELANAFPFGLRDSPYSKHLFYSFVPPRERALELADLYYRNAAWMYDPVVRGEFMDSIVDSLYGTSGIVSLDMIHPHRLSVFFMILATGILFDEHPSAAILAEQYHALACAALSLDSIVKEATCSAVQAVFIMFHFIYLSDRSSNERRWLLTGLCGRLSQSVKRDSAGWNLNRAEVERRRIMFWELFTWDAWTSVVNGRPPSLSIHFTDARFPEDLDPLIKPSGEVELGFHAWKFRYSATCLSISVTQAFSTKVPTYAALLELDKKIRTFPVPLHLQSPVQGPEAGRAWSPDPTRAMQQYCVVCERESNLLYIHRSYFVQALRDKSGNPLAHKYAPSVLATYRSACRLITSLRGLYPIHPSLTSRIWFFWSGIFSACIVLGALVVECPGCTLASNALQELNHTYSFYEEGSRLCRTPATMIMVEKLQHRAHASYAAYRAGSSSNTTHPTSDLRHRSRETPDELEVIGGRMSVIATKSPSQSPSSHVSSDSEGHTAPLAQSEMSNAFSNQFGDTHPSMVDFYQGIGNFGFEPPPLIEGNPGPNYLTPSPLYGLSPLPQGLGGRTLSQSGNEQLPPLIVHPSRSAPQNLDIAMEFVRPEPSLPPFAPVPPGPIHQGGSFGSGAEYNQDEIWRNYVQQLGL
ncbi:hypothetical protein JAAARDRAFT_704939 [Jaapia argillacea MUCL 33604]|uniref:Xylanolytic transcriptional activator regulatory domain-containing protein n=1 Tax=Jaapia argillacea MUCL 33604 TaxID=933084 RepID=A0A067Q3B2_9AGAM|nr:hypothetical protein JAAARDRAFT_704939 [Jaapia argillacea MUCL 33604]